VSWRERSAAANAVVRAIEHFRVHRTGRNAALVAHYGFLSIFPLMLVLTTILGLVLQGHPHLQQQIIDSAFSRLPIIGQQLQAHPDELTGSIVVLVVGLLTALWASLRAFNVLQTSLDDIAEVPLDARRPLLATRVRSLLGIVVVGGGQAAGAFLTSTLGFSSWNPLGRAGLGVVSIAVNAAVLGTTYRVLCVAPESWRGVAPGALIGGLTFSVLQAAGTTVVARAIANASPVYGTFATVIGLITWLNLHAIVALLGAELNGVLPATRLAPATTSP
jgi:membrane protein